MTKKVFFTLFLLIASQHIFSQQSQYNIKDFGAVGDGKTVCTNAINQAITKCSEDGGGRVVIPAGTFKSGTIVMKNNVELYFAMNATLLASTDGKDYPTQPKPEYRSLRDDPRGWLSLIYAEKMSNIAITGFGTINGNGALQKPRVNIGNDLQGRPNNILFISCHQVRVEGITMLHSGMWCQHYLNCEDVVIDKINVYNHSNKNNDAIDIDGCRRFMLSNSVFDSEDDGITLKSTGTAPCEDVTITNCVVSTFSNAIKCGTESTGGFRNITISNCVVKPSRCPENLYEGVKCGDTGISLEIVDGGVMENVAISNIVIEGTESPLYIRLGNRATKHTDDAPQPPVGKIRNVTIDNIVAYNTGNFTSSITGIPGHDVENVSINNIQFYNRGGLVDGQYKATPADVPEDEKGYPDAVIWGNLPSSVFFIRHAKGLSINNLTFGSNENDPRIPVIAVAVERLRIGKSIFSGASPHPFFILLENVTDFDIEKPLGWGQNQVMKQ